MKKRYDEYDGKESLRKRVSESEFINVYSKTDIILHKEIQWDPVVAWEGKKTYFA